MEFVFLLSFDTCLNLQPLNQMAKKPVAILTDEYGTYIVSESHIYIFQGLLDLCDESLIVRVVIRRSP